MTKFFKGSTFLGGLRAYPSRKVFAIKIWCSG